MKITKLIFILLLSLSLNLISNEINYFPIKFRDFQDNRTIIKNINIYDLPKGKYQENIFYIKFRNKTDIISAKERIINSKLLSNLNDVKITDIRNPFKINGLNSKIDLKLENIYVVNFNSEETPYNICKNLSLDPNIEYACPVYNRYINETPNDPKLAEQPYLNKILAKSAWDITKGDSNIIIGIIDSGFDIKHPELKNQVFNNKLEIPGDSIDNDKNGFVDDVNGWDFIGNIGWEDADFSRWKPDNSVIPISSTNEHGTHVAGIISAEQNNNIGIAGIAPNCRFLPVKCALDNMDENAGGSRRIFSGFEAITYATNLGAKVISCSWSGEGFSPVEQDIVNQLAAKGVVIVAAAGNDGVLLDRIKLFPASYNGVIAVGASDNNDQKLSYSQFGVKVAIYAPGTSILSTTPNNTYSTKSGTSMATPMVSAAVALLKSIRPELSNKEIYHQIRSTSDNVITHDANLRPFYYGRLNLNKMLIYNNPNFDVKLVPGISVDNFSVNSNSSITDTNNLNLKLVVKNYLEESTNIKVLITEFDNYLTIKNNFFKIDRLQHFDTISLNPIIKLNNNNPWFKGYARFLISYIADNNYIDYELLEIPIDLATNNKFTVAEKFPVYHDIVWKEAVSKSEFDFSAVGYYNETGNGIYYHFMNPVPFQLLTNDTLSSINSFKNTIFIGTKPSTGTAKLIKSFDGGDYWKSQSITGLKSINHIHFYDTNRVIILGETDGGKFGAAQSTNSGVNWIMYDNLPSKLQYANNIIEQMSENAIKVTDSIICFGTSYGRNILSFDRGKNWIIINSNDTLASLLMDFNSNQKGTQIYQKKNTEEYFIKHTTDAGNTWVKSNFNFQNGNLIPIYLYAPDSSKMVTMLCRGGEVLKSTDYGENWDNLLTDEYFFNNLQTGAGYTNSKGVRLWNTGFDFTYLDFANIPILSIKKLVLLSKNLIDFDTLKINQAIDTIVFLQNQGNTSIIISNIIFKNSLFTIDQNYQKEIKPNEIVSYKITPKTNKEGIFTDKMTFKSDSEAGDIDIVLMSTVVDPSSVVEEKNSISFYQLNRSIIFNENINCTYQIIDLSGKDIQNGLITGNELSITEPISNGIYLLKLLNNGIIFTSKFLFFE